MILWPSRAFPDHASQTGHVQSLLDPQEYVEVFMALIAQSTSLPSSFSQAFLHVYYLSQLIFLTQVIAASSLAFKYF